MSVIKNQHIYLPNRNLDYSKWAVIACDQFTSDEEYWDTVKSYTSGSPTALSLIFPEIYLSKDNEEKIREINQNMVAYYQSNLMVDEGPCMILVNRSTKQHKQRLGIVLAVDLEEYTFKADEPALIKATEGTIIDRIPPRVEIRKEAIKVFNAVDGAGLARVDFFVENGTNKVIFNELNTLPGFTSISMYPKLWEAVGLPINELIDELIELAFTRER